VRERKEEDKASPLFSFSQILALLLVINNSILNIQPITSKSLWLGICTYMVYGIGILSSVLLLITGNLSHGDDIPDILDIPSTVPLYPYRYGTATYACLASCIVYATVVLTVVMISHLM
jgi:hypothetical protein